MKHSLLILFIVVSLITYAQNKTCDCLIKLEEDGRIALNLAKPGETIQPTPPEYKPLLTNFPHKSSIHKVVKDSAMFWYIEPFANNPQSNKSLVKFKKLASTFLVNVQFNGKDSVPVYAEADETSKIVRYIKPKKATQDNEYWFSGCKPGFVKLLFVEQRMPTGWISKSYYLHK